MRKKSILPKPWRHLWLKSEYAWRPLLSNADYYDKEYYEIIKIKNFAN